MDEGSELAGVEEREQIRNERAVEKMKEKIRQRLGCGPYTYVSLGGRRTACSRGRDRLSVRPVRRPQTVPFKNILF